MDGKTLFLAIAPALLCFLGVGVGAVLSRRGQHRQWLRDRKIEAVSAYVEDMNLWVDWLREASARGYRSSPRMFLLSRLLPLCYVGKSFRLSMRVSMRFS
jgi:hypothetical protein